MKSIKKQKTKQSDNMDLFRDLKGSNKLNDIDDKIKFLKSQLTSLIETNSNSKETRNSSNYLSLTSLLEENTSFDVKSNKNDKFDYSLSFDEAESKEVKNNKDFFNCGNQNVEEINKSRYNPEPVATKFSNWLSTTIDLIDEEIKDDKTPKNKKTMIYFNTENSENSESSFNDSSFRSKSAFKLPQHKVETLLYESFLLQNLGKHLSSSEESELEVVEVPSKRIKSFSKKHNFHHSSLKRKRSSKIIKKANRKRKRLVTLNSSNSDIEVVHIDTSTLNSETDPIKNTEQIDLEDINWDEPFYLEETNAFEPLMVDEVDNVEEEKNSENVLVEGAEYSKNISSKQSTCEKEVESANELALNCKSETKKTCWECPICFEESKGQEVVTTLCGHIFCKQCIENHLSIYGQICPACRTDICNKPLITLFNF